MWSPLARSLGVWLPTLHSPHVPKHQATDSREPVMPALPGDACPRGGHRCPVCDSLSMEFWTRSPLCSVHGKKNGERLLVHLLRPALNGQQGLRMLRKPHRRRLGARPCSHACQRSPQGAAVTLGCWGQVGSSL